MTTENYLFDALDVVLSWDTPEELLPQAVQSQAGLMAGIPYDEVDSCLD
jgi:hypothetical protein